MIHPLRTVFVVTAFIVLLTSCSWSQVFHVDLTVVDANDGKPVSDAKVVVDTLSNEDRQKNDPPERYTTVWTTDEAGRVEFDFSISGYTASSGRTDKWYLKVKKEGYKMNVTDIKPNPLPDGRSDGAKIPLTVRVEMQHENVH